MALGYLQVKTNIFTEHTEKTYQTVSEHVHGLKMATCTKANGRTVKDLASVDLFGRKSNATIKASSGKI